MTPQQQLPITVRFLNRHNNLISDMAIHFRKPVSIEYLKKLYDNWERLRDAIEKYCDKGQIDPYTSKVYTNANGMVEKLEAEAGHLGDDEIVDMRVSEMGIRQMLTLKLKNFDTPCGMPSKFFIKNNPHQDKPVGVVGIKLLP